MLATPTVKYFYLGGTMRIGSGDFLTRDSVTLRDIQRPKPIGTNRVVLSSLTEPSTRSDSWANPCFSSRSAGGLTNSLDAVAGWCVADAVVQVREVKV